VKVPFDISINQLSQTYFISFYKPEAFPFVIQKNLAEPFSIINCIVTLWLRFIGYHVLNQEVYYQKEFITNNEFLTLEQSHNLLFKSNQLEHLIKFTNSFIQKESSSITDVQNIQEQVCKEWHQCFERGWPCDDGTGAKKSLANALIYFAKWREENPDDFLKDALANATANHECEQQIIGCNLNTVKSSLWEKIKPDNFSLESACSFFMSNFLESDLMKKYLPNKGSVTSDNETLRCFSSVARIAQHLLANIPIDSKTIEAFVWVLAEYSHSKLKIEHRLDITSHLLQAARGEPALHVLKEYYRDHFYHAIQVCLLGHFLLNSGTLEGKPLWKRVAKILGKIEFEDVLRQWYVAALLHDIGYSMEIFQGVKSLLEFFQHSTPIKEFTDNLDSAMSDLSKSLAGFEGFTEEQNPAEDHGIIGANHIHGLIEHIKKEQDVKDLSPAIRAVALHNNRKRDVSFQENPLAFLLILCDTIQEHNRPQLRYSSAPSTILAQLSGQNRVTEVSSGPLETLEFNIVNKDGKPPVFRFANSLKLKFTLEYGNEINTNAGVFNLWIDSTCNLQRLKFDGLEFNIIIEYITPKFSNGTSSNAIPQIHRLQDAISETHMNFLKDWLPKQSDDTNDEQAVKHSISSDKPNKEKLTLNLKKLTKKKLITSDISEFRKRLTKWRYYHQDRDFTSDYAPVIPG